MGQDTEKAYKVIFFDWHKTLGQSDFWGQLKDQAHDRHHWHQPIVTFLFIKNDHLVQRWMRGEVNEEGILKTISEKFGCPKETLREDLAESCRAMALASPEILPLITALRRKGIKCVIATDNMDVFKEYVVPSLKLDKYFDDILVSFNQKALKFDVAEDGNSLPFFHMYLQANELTYADAILFDDRTDTSGAYKKLGFDTFQVEDTNGLLEKMENLLKA